ncbi:MAG: hypothetical protein CM1200mP36_06400 [Gammaproteobacteria bacterium]|jgi:thiamine kinase-like enzyme|nr:MAG: hypothetical protein CM1200mP36_06400 [Gammaproteobacteria bacterium]|tara:strand:- start:93 stop:989 length:897 start_codon:yes stop_codon:yes gene_type:complete
MYEAIVGQEDLSHLSRLLKVNASDLLVEPLPGGLSNRSFHFSYGEKQWAVRLPKNIEANRFQTLDIECEQQLLAVVAQTGLTPKVVLYDPDTGALITEFLRNAVPWTPEIARLPENIERIATTLRSLHGIRVSPDLLSPFYPVQLAERYLNMAYRSQRSEDRNLAVEEKHWEEELRRLAGLYEARFPPNAVCHHDLVAANILEDDQLWLLDFEYAMWADPVLDLASLSAMNGYDATQRNLLSQKYFDAEPIPFATEHLDDVIRLELLLSYFWAVSRQSAVEEADDMIRFADSMAAMLR